MGFYVHENSELWHQWDQKPVAYGEKMQGYTLHQDVPFKRIHYPYTDEDNRYHKHRNKNSKPLDGRS